jgi:hypothetical protein
MPGQDKTLFKLSQTATFNADVIAMRNFTAMRTRSWQAGCNRVPQSV